MNNDFFVSVQGDYIITLKQVPQRITREQALNLAAWIVALADPDEKFAEILEKVLDT